MNHFEPLLGRGAGFRTGNKERPRVGAATPHAAAQLMQLREAVSVGIKDDDAAGLLDVHADFDHRGGHQDRSLAAGKIGHELGFDVILVAAGQSRKPNALELWKFLQPVGDFGHRMQWRASHGFAIFVEGFVGVVDADGIGRRARRTAARSCAGTGTRCCGASAGRTGCCRNAGTAFVLLIIRINARAHDIGPLPRVDSRANVREHTPHGGGVGLIDHHGTNRFAAARQFGEPGNIEIAKPSHGGGARDGRGGHHQ